MLKEQVAPAIVNGYRKGEGVDPERYPTQGADLKARESLEEHVFLDMVHLKHNVAHMSGIQKPSEQASHLLLRS